MKETVTLWNVPTKYVDAIIGTLSRCIQEETLACHWDEVEDLVYIIKRAKQDLENAGEEQ